MLNLPGWTAVMLAGVWCSRRGHEALSAYPAIDLSGCHPRQPVDTDPLASDFCCYSALFAQSFPSSAVTTCAHSQCNFMDEGGWLTLDLAAALLAGSHARGRSWAPRRLRRAHGLGSRVGPCQGCCSVLELGHRSAATVQLVHPVHQPAVLGCQSFHGKAGAAGCGSAVSGGAGCCPVSMPGRCPWAHQAPSPAGAGRGCAPSPCGGWAGRGTRASAAARAAARAAAVASRSSGRMMRSGRGGWRMGW